MAEWYACDLSCQCFDFSPTSADTRAHTSSLFIFSMYQAQFGATYYAKFMTPSAEITPVQKDKVNDESEAANTGNPLENLFLSIPTDEDLRRIYFWEARRVGEKERERFVS